MTKKFDTLISTLERDIKLLDENTADLFKQRAALQKKLKQLKEDRAEYPQYREEIDRTSVQLGKQLIEVNQQLDMDRKEGEKLRLQLSEIKLLKKNIVGKMKRIPKTRDFIKFKAAPEGRMLTKLLVENEKKRIMRDAPARVHGTIGS